MYYKIDIKDEGRLDEMVKKKEEGGEKVQVLKCIVFLGIIVL